MSDLSDDIGKRAFASVVRSIQYGDPEPGHVLEKAAESNLSQMTGGLEHKWISQAPKFKGVRFYDDDFTPTPEFAAWLSLERQNLYKSHMSDGHVMLIQNPDAWEWKVLKGAQHFIRPDPVATDEFISLSQKR